MRLVAISAGAIVSLLLASVAVIFWATAESSDKAPETRGVARREDLRTGAAPPPHRVADGAVVATAVVDSAKAPASQAPSSVAPDALGVTSAARRPSTPSVSPRDGLTRSAGGSLSAATVRVRRNFRGELESGLAALQNKVAECYAGPASFTLDVESVPGGIRIVDARIENQDEANDAGIACAQQLLRGHVIDAPSVDPGKRWEIPFATRTP